VTLVHDRGLIAPLSKLSRFILYLRVKRHGTSVCEKSFERLTMRSSKVIILTGASRGIGLAVAEYLLKASQRLVLVARSAEPLENLKKQYPGQVEVLAADLSDLSVRLALFSR
jgi:NADPH:quinone reductase-like Zn-dependent oxidoreductase